MGGFGTNKAHAGGGGILALTRRQGGGGVTNHAQGGGGVGANEAHRGGGVVSARQAQYAPRETRHAVSVKHSPVASTVSLYTIGQHLKGNQI